MKAMLAILGFEFRQRMKLLSTHIYFLIFLALSMLWMAAAGGAFSEATVSFGAKAYVNSPYAVAQTIAFLTYAGVIVIAAVMGRAVQQDFEYRIHDFFFCAPISKHQYLLGRFFGAWLTLVYIFASIGLGAWLAIYLPGLDAERFGPSHILHYILPYLYITLPNLLILGGMFFMLAATTRRMLPVYVGGVLLLIGYLIASRMAQDLEYRDISALLDPFGIRAQARLTEYWPIHDKNNRTLTLEGIFLFNRLLWAGLGILLFALGAWRFRFTSRQELRAPRSEEKTDSPKSVQFVRHAPDFSQYKPSRLLWPLTWLNLRETIKNVYFGVIVLAGVLLMFFIAREAGKAYGVQTWPVTYNMLEMLSGSFALFMLITTTFYSGELVWREREAGLALMHDALPLPNWLYMLPKLLALILMQGLMLLLVLLCGLCVQAVQGYFKFEINQYLFQLFVLQWPQYALLAVLAITVQVLVNQKYLGFFVMIVYYLVSSLGPQFGLEHPMLFYGHIPEYTYSDINQYGHALPKMAWFGAYWGGLALILLCIALALWPRGVNDEWRSRLQLARMELSPRVLGAAGLGLTLFLACGGVIFYNTNVLNDYTTSFEREEQQASYEKRYKRLQDRPQPRISDVRLKVDIEPYARSAQIAGSYRVQNRSDKPIHEIYVNLPREARVRKMEFKQGAAAQIADKELGMYSYKLDEALAPGASAELDFALDYAPKGMLGLESDTPVIYNGSFFNQDVLPHLGYHAEAELVDDRVRKKHGLAPKERMLPRDDARGLAFNPIGPDADWVSFEAILSTAPDQIAIAPGYLQKQWQANGKAYFHYRMDQPILNFYAFQSARYAVKKDQWRGLPLEIYYQPGHEYNLDRMFNGIKDSLNYFSRAFSPYQHKQVRIIEFPRYATFAQSFPNTIPYSEAIGFIARVDDNDPHSIDYPYYVTAHEVAHQWWGHQVVPGNTRGQTMMIETLAQYSALMVMKRKYGPEKMRRFLRYELDRYLQERAHESKKELPLAHTENQGYIHYRKGSVIMYHLQEALGEEKINAVLQDIVRQHGGRGAPYPSSAVLVQGLLNIAPPEFQYLVKESLEDIVLYENRALSAQGVKLADGKYQVTLKFDAGKVRADELGKETPMQMNDWVEFGVDDENGKPLLREKRWIKRGEQSLQFVVAAKPAKAGIDPDNKLIDRKPADNMVRLELENGRK
ncbi:M1 family aminopeptidase [Massilia sp. W12]|uniref:ABC transporter permease/M1 family aminopeptidase n=1 Tax=Massilia sp. W12 TaxID=3126507 RepID=UPI0030D1C877